MTAKKYYFLHKTKIKEQNIWLYQNQILILRKNSYMGKLVFINNDEGAESSIELENEPDWDDAHTEQEF